MVGPARLTVTAVIRTGRPIPDVVIPFVRSLERSAALRDGSKATAGRSPRPHVPPVAEILGMVAIAVSDWVAIPVVV
jgi:hypothetical protein